MPLPLAAAVGVGLGYMIKAILVRVVVTLLLYELFSFIFRLCSYLFINESTIQHLINAIGVGTNTITLGEAFDLLPTYAAQLFFFMHLNESISMVGATFTAILGIKLFGRVMDRLRIGG